MKKIPDRPVLPPLPPLDLTSGACDDMAHHTIRMPDEVPTFEQFIRILKDDEYYDPRYRNKVGCGEHFRYSTAHDQIEIISGSGAVALRFR